MSNTKMNRVKIGRKAQDIAANFLQDAGMTFVTANFHAQGGEIDLIMKEAEYTVFVEVKYRRGVKWGLPREAVDLIKTLRIKKAALQYIAQHNLEDEAFRFDVVEVLKLPDKLLINHIKDAFW
ncbi:MAG: YraN family protein [Turicibacter sp.]|nr:YraN family protein [Turicibacter sp.]